MQCFNNNNKTGPGAQPNGGCLAAAPPSKFEIKKITQDDINGFYVIYSSTKISH